MTSVLSFSSLSLRSAHSRPSLLSLAITQEYKPGKHILKATYGSFFFFAVTAIATGIQLPPSRVSAAASAAPTSTVMRWTQVGVVDSACSLMLIKSQMPACKGGINVFDFINHSVATILYCKASFQMPVTRRAHSKGMFNVWFLTLPFTVKGYRCNGSKFLPKAYFFFHIGDELPISIRISHDKQDKIHTCLEQLFSQVWWDSCGSFV